MHTAHIQPYTPSVLGLWRALYISASLQLTANSLCLQIIWGKKRCKWFSPYCSSFLFVFSSIFIGDVSCFFQGPVSLASCSHCTSLTFDKWWKRKVKIEKEPSTNLSSHFAEFQCRRFSSMYSCNKRGWEGLWWQRGRQRVGLGAGRVRAAVWAVWVVAVAQEEEAHKRRERTISLSVVSFLIPTVTSF